MKKETKANGKKKSPKTTVKQRPLSKQAKREKDIEEYMNRFIDYGKDALKAAKEILTGASTTAIRNRAATLAVKTARELHIQPEIVSRRINRVLSNPIEKLWLLHLYRIKVEDADVKEMKRIIDGGGIEMGQTHALDIIEIKYNPTYLRNKAA